MDPNLIQSLGGYAPIIILLVLMWFMLIRPQQQQAKKRREMLSDLKRGDLVVTVGGIQGRIEQIDDKKLKLKVTDQVVLDMIKESIGYVVEPDGENKSGSA